VPLQTLTVRHAPAALAGDEPALAAHNLAIARRINEGGTAYLTPSILKGKQTIRISIGAEATERRHVEALWRALGEAAAAQSAALRR
jgi:aromatic-L-amino-acid decarboxylase